MQSVDRALALLLRVVDDGACTSLVDLGRSLGLAPATSYRLVKSLERAGMLVSVNRGRFAVGPALTGRPAQLSWRSGLASCARPILRRLARTTQGVAHIGILENDMVTYLVREGDDAEIIFSEEDKQLEAYCSGVGKMLLAMLPRGVQDAYLAAGPFVALTERTIIDPVELRAELDRIATCGFARDNGEAALDVHCLAVPICGPDGKTVAALSISHAEARPVEDRVLPKLRAACAELETTLFKNIRSGDVPSCGKQERSLLGRPAP